MDHLHDRLGYSKRRICRAVGQARSTQGYQAKMPEADRRLAAARLRHIAGMKWGMRRYLTVERLTEQNREAGGPRRKRAG